MYNLGFRKQVAGTNILLTCAGLDRKRKIHVVNLGFVVVERFLELRQFRRAPSFVLAFSARVLALELTTFASALSAEFWIGNWAG